MNALEIVLKPRLSEKAYGLSTLRNTYVFDVLPTLNKVEIKAAVEQQFKVTVVSVNTVRKSGKKTRSVINKRKSIPGKRKETKRAYVMIAEGQSLPVFAALEESTAPAPKAETKKEKK